MTKMENAPNGGAPMQGPQGPATGAPYKTSQMQSNRNLKSRGGLSANWTIESIDYDF